MSYKYISIWTTSINQLIGRVNFFNREPEVKGRSYELIQILRQPTAGDTPGGDRTEGWIGIVKVTTQPPPVDKTHLKEEEGSVKELKL